MKIVDLIKKNYLLSALVITIIVFGIISEGKLFYPGNIMNLFQQNMYVFILASGMFICILTGGNSDLSCGSVVCFIASVAAKLMEYKVNTLVILLLMILIGIIVGLIHGYLIGKFELPSIIVTLASMIIIRGFANLILKGYTLPVSDETFMILFSVSRGFPFYIIFVLLSVLSAIYISEYAPIGKHIYAVGGNASSAKISGINKARIIIFAYVFMGVCCAVAAGVVSGRMENVGSNLGETYAMDAIAACFIGGVSVSGGKGRMSQVIIGALLMGIINQGMSIIGLSVNWQYVIKGVILVAAVLLGHLLNKEEGLTK